jgi:anti-sigma factor RsiW
MHLDDGQIRAYIDGEPGDRSMDEISQHLAGCPACQSRLEELKKQAAGASQRLSFLASSAGEPSPAPRLAPNLALAQFTHRLKQQKELPMSKKFFRPRTAWAGLAIVLLLGIALSIPSGFAWAGQFLGLFRVQQVAVIPIDPTGLLALKGDSALGQQIGQMLSKSVTFDQKPAKPFAVANAADASKAAGFSVRLPTSETGQPQLAVQPGAAFKFVIDRARAQALLDESGHKDLVLPQSLDQETISVSVPTAVTASYGTCPSIDETGASQMGSNGRRYADCVILGEIPSPTVNTPPDVDFQKLAEIGLEFTGMSASQAQAFAQSIDWTSSLVIPLPKNAATYNQLTVDGVNGMLIQRPADDAPEFALVWVKNGIIYTIGGLGANSAQAVDMANSLK